jgi:hypothetical protein
LLVKLRKKLKRLLDRRSKILHQWLFRRSCDTTRQRGHATEMVGCIENLLRLSEKKPQ